MIILIAMKLAIMVLNLERKNKDMNNNVDIDILNIVSENDFDKNTTTKEYRESVLEAIKIEKMLVNNLAESVKFLATNPNLSKERFKGSAFSLTTTGGVLLTCLILGHIGKIKKLSLKVDKKVLENLRELGLILFLLGSGIAGGTKFIEYFKVIYFFYGILITLIPLIIGFFFNKYVLKLCLLNNLGSLTGAMTSTPALGTLINVSKTDNIGNPYAATYPISLISVVLSAQFMVLLMK